MITQTSISYYGLNYVEHAEADFKEMKAHGVTQVILAVTEFDFDFWRPNIPAIVAKAHELGLAACWIHRAKEELESPLGQKILAKAGLEGEWEGVGHLALGYADMPLPEPHPYNAARYITI